MCGIIKIAAIMLKVKAKFSCDHFTLNPFHIYVKFVYAFENVQATTYIEDY